MLRRLQKEAQALGWVLVYIEIIACYLSRRFFQKRAIARERFGLLRTSPCTLGPDA